MGRITRVLGLIHSNIKHASWQSKRPTDRADARVFYQLEPLESRVLLSSSPIGSDTPEDNLTDPLVATAPAAAPSSPEQDLVAFAQQLAAAGVKFFGANWCPHCADQKRLFEDGAHFLPYIEVGGEALGTFNSVAADENINSVPTWEFPDQSRLEGIQTLETLSQRSGVAIPTSSDPFIAPIADVTVLAGAPLHIALDGYDPNGGALTFSATSSNEALIATSIPRGNRSMRIAVGTPGSAETNADIPSANYGEMVFELFETRSGRATDQIIALAESGFYENVRFHRILNNFVIQGGDREDDEGGIPAGTGGSPLGDFDDQFHVDLQHVQTGLLSMAKSRDDTGDSQFFITEGPSRHLDFNHSIFGFLVEGEAVRETVSNVPASGSGVPDDAIGMQAVDIFVDEENATLMLLAPQGTSAQTSVTVTVTDEQGNWFERTFNVTVTPDTTDGNPFLADIPTIRTLVDTTVTFQLTAIDAEGQQNAVFLDEEFLDQVQDPANPGFPLFVPVRAHEDLVYSVDSNTGLVTVTPTNGLTGTHGITVATAVFASAVDYQVVPIHIETVPSVDLVTSVDPTALPATTIVGDGLSVAVPVTVTNEGNNPVASGQTIELQLFARPVGAVDNSNDVLLSTFTDLLIGDLAQGTSQTFTIGPVLSSLLSAGSYVLVAGADAGDAVSESDESNNTVATPQSLAVTVEDPAVDLTIKIDETQLPDIALAGTSLNVPVTIRNGGNVPIADGRVIDVLFAARPDGAVDDSADITLTTLAGQPVGNLGPGASISIEEAVSIPVDLPDGLYHLVAVVDAANDVGEFYENNNADVSTDTLIQTPFVDLTVQIDDAQLPNTAVAGTVLNVPVSITNDGNVPIADGQVIDVLFAARPDGAVDDSADITLTTVAGQPVGNLGPGASISIEEAVSIPVDLPDGLYHLVAVVDAANDVGEFYENNNADVSTDTLIQTPFVDLTVQIDDAQLPNTAVAGTVLNVPVSITNDGNVPIADGQVIDVLFAARPDGAVDDSADITLTTVAGQPVGNLGPGASISIEEAVSIPVDLPDGLYHLVAVVDAANDVGEFYEDNNADVSTDTLLIQTPFVDLTVQIDDAQLPNTAVAGTVLNVPVSITNDGNVPIADGQVIDVLFAARPDGAVDGSSDVMLTTLTGQPIGGLGPAASTVIDATVSIPVDLPVNAYHFVAIVDSGDAVSESDEDNNTAVSTATTTVQEPFVDLTASIVEAQLPDTAFTGTTVNIPVSVTNGGNVAIADGQTIDVLIAARPDGAVDGSTDVVLTTLAGHPIGGLAPAAASVIDAAVLIPASLPDNAYHFVATVDSGDAVSESDENNNTTVATTTTTVQAAFVDLTVSFVEAQLPDTAFTGSTVNIPVSVTNGGNVAIADGQTIDVLIAARPDGAVDNSADVALTTLVGQPSGGLGPAASTLINAMVLIPVGLPDNAYHFVATVDSNGAFSESDENNNTAVSTATTAVQAPFVDLTASVVESQLPDTAFTGTTVNIPVSVTNGGNVSIADGQTIDVLIAARPDGAVDSSADVALTTLTGQPIGALGPASSTVIDAMVLIPADLAADSYHLVVVVDAAGAVSESDENNNTSVSTATTTVLDEFVDLTASIDDSQLPNTTLAGTTVNIPVSVTNGGNVPVADGQTIDVFFAARPDGAVDSSADVALAILAGQAIGGLAPAASTVINATVLIPVGLPDNAYHFVAIVDSDAAVTESNENNNTAVSTAATTVENPFVDLTASIDDSQLPDTLATGGVLNVPVSVTNGGNIPIADGQTIDVLIAARLNGAVDGSADVTLTTLTGQLIGGLGPAASTVVDAAVSISAALTANAYHLVATVDAAGAVSESDENNNTAVSTASITVLTEFVDLTAQIVAPKLPPGSVVSGDGTKVTLPLVITNNGNLPVAAGTRISIRVVARSVTDNAEDLVATITNQSISGLKPNAIKKLNLIVTLPAGLVGDYQLVALIDSANQVDEGFEENNQAATNPSTPINMLEGFMDLETVMGSKLKLPPPVVAGNATRIILPLEITNRGNLPITRNQKINIDVFARPLGGDGSTDRPVATMQNVSVSNLAPGKVKKQNVAINLPVDLPVDQYQIVAIADASFAVSEALNGVSLEDNNTAVTDAATPIIVAAPFMDLVAAVGSRVKLPQAVVAGDGTRITLPLEITNLGNVPITRNQKIEIDVLARPVGGGSPDILITTLQNVSVSNLGPGKVKKQNVIITLPVDLPANQYQIVTLADASNIVVESDDSNNTTQTNAATPIDVAEGFLDLETVLGSRLKLPPSVVAGDGTRITLPLEIANLGNVPVARNQKIEIDVLARPLDGSPDILITTLQNVSVSNLGPGKVKKQNAAVNLPVNLPENDYQIVVFADASFAVSEALNGVPLEDNNTAVTDAATPIVVAAPFMDLDAAVGSRVKLPTSVVAGDGTRITLPLEITNLGNVPITRSQKIEIDVLARPLDGSADILITTLQNVSVSNLGPGKVKKQNVIITLPADLPPDQYQIAALADASGVVVESIEESNDPTNNEAVTNGATPIFVAEPFLDLTTVANNPRLPAGEIISGNGKKITLPLAITNQGNVPIAPGQKINIDVFARPSGVPDGSDDELVTTLTNQVISNLKPSDKKFNAGVLLPVGLPTDTYLLVAKADTSNAVAEENKDNNTAVTPPASAFAVTEGVVDLTGTFGNVILPDSVVINTLASGRAEVLVTNAGNLAVGANALVDIRFAMRPVSSGDDTGDVALGTLSGQKIGRLAPSRTKKFVAILSNFQVTAPEGNYFLVAILDSADQVDESDESNNTLIDSTTVTVTPA